MNRESQAAGAASALALWRREGDAGRRIAAPRWMALMAAQPPAEINGGAIDPYALVIGPIRSANAAIGIAVVSEVLSGVVLHNGAPLPAGVHALAHGDQINLNGSTYWLAAERAAIREEYDPAVHGDDAFCHLTKARLHAGMSIVVCGGTPQKQCGVIYKAEAWDMAESADPPIPCSNCGYVATRDQWQPTIPLTPKSLQQRLEHLLARKE
jgi:hypothetical protein